MVLFGKYVKGKKVILYQYIMIMLIASQRSSDWQICYKNVIAPISHAELGWSLDVKIVKKRQSQGIFSHQSNLT